MSDAFNIKIETGAKRYGYKLNEGGTCMATICLKLHRKVFRD